MLASIGSIFRMFSTGREKRDEGPGEGEGRQPGVSIPGLHHGSVAGPGPCDTGPCPTFSTADSLPPARGAPAPADRRWLSAPAPHRVPVRDLGVWAGLPPRLGVWVGGM